MALFRVIAASHSARRLRPCADGQRHRGKPQHRNIGNLPGAQKASRLEQAQLLAFAASGEVFAVKPMRPQRRFRVSGTVGWMAGQKVEPVAGERSANPKACQGEGCSGPIAKALLQ